MQFILVAFATSGAEREFTPANLVRVVGRLLRTGSNTELGRRRETCRLLEKTLG